MLRFRPIVPKPDTGGLPVVNNNVFVMKKRVKRKYVRVCKKNQYKRKQETSSDHQGNEKEDDSSSNNRIVTLLQLLPEKSDLKESPDLDRTVTTKCLEDNQDPPMWFNGVLDRTVVMSWVTVESVTDICMEGGGGGGELGSTDLEKVNNLERDTCPGFISDGLNKVTWVNQAYKRMVMVSQQSDRQLPGMEGEVMLVVKEKLPCLCPAFTCRVRLQYTWQNNQCSKMVPCDVWRMEFGGFAWRLDVKAALSLGL